MLGIDYRDGYNSVRWLHQATIVFAWVPQLLECTTDICPNR
jgi:hypothetical protein